MLKLKNKKKGQVWIETVTYTLVAFVLIALILAFVKPKIDQLQDQALIEQSFKMLNGVDSVINSVYDTGTGNKRMVELSIKKGALTINSTNNSISFLFEGRHMYSEPGVKFKEGSFDVSTTQEGSDYIILIERHYPGLNFTYLEREETRTLPSSSTPYILFISNKGGPSQQIDFQLQ